MAWIGSVAPAALDAHLHLQRAVLVERREDDVSCQDLHVGVALEVASLHHAHPLRLQAQDLRTVHVELEHDLAKVEHDVERVLGDPRQVRELVQDIGDLHPRRRRSVDRGQQDSTIRVADGEGEA